MGKTRTKNRKNKKSTPQHRDIPADQPTKQRPSPSATTTATDIKSYDGSAEKPSPSSMSSYGPGLERQEKIQSKERDTALEPPRKQRRQWWSIEPCQWWPCRAMRFTRDFIAAFLRLLFTQWWLDQLMTLLLLTCFLFACWAAMEGMLRIFRPVNGQETDGDCSIVYVTVPGPIITVSLIGSKLSDPNHGTYYYSVINGTTQWLGSIAPPTQFSTLPTQSPGSTTAFPSPGSSPAVGSMLSQGTLSPSSTGVPLPITSSSSGSPLSVPSPHSTQPTNSHTSGSLATTAVSGTVPTTSAPASSTGQPPQPLPSSPSMTRSTVTGSSGISTTMIAVSSSQGSSSTSALSHSSSQVPSSSRASAWPAPSSPSRSSGATSFSGPTSSNTPQRSSGSVITTAKTVTGVVSGSQVSTTTRISTTSASETTPYPSSLVVSESFSSPTEGTSSKAMSSQSVHSTVSLPAPSRSSSTPSFVTTATSFGLSSTPSPTAGSYSPGWSSVGSSPQSSMSQSYLTATTTTVPSIVRSGSVVSTGTPSSEGPALPTSSPATNSGSMSSIGSAQLSVSMPGRSSTLSSSTVFSTRVPTTVPPSSPTFLTTSIPGPGGAPPIFLNSTSTNLTSSSSTSLNVTTSTSTMMTKILAYGNTQFSFVFPKPLITTTVSYWTGTYPTETGPDWTSLPPTTRIAQGSMPSELPSFEHYTPRAFRTVVTKVIEARSLSRTATKVAVAADPEPTLCGESGNFTLNFDDTTVSGQDNDVLPVGGMKNPYHHLFYANGFAYVPDKWEPYPAASQPNVAVFLPIGSSLLPASPFAGTLLPGELGAGPRASVDAYWFNAYSGFFGCALNGVTSCTLRITGYRYDATMNQEVVAARQNVTISPCWGYINCQLTQVSFSDQFRGLSGIQFNAFTSNLGIPQMFVMDSLQMEWYNNTCSAGILRIGHNWGPGAGGAS